MTPDPDIRWQQRFQNFDRAFVLLREACERDPASLSQLEKEGMVQRFEFAFELAWKTLKDYLDASGVRLDVITPRATIKQAFAAKLLQDGQVWIDMMLLRNMLSHSYDFKTFETSLGKIREHYFPAFDRLHEFFVNANIAS